MNKDDIELQRLIALRTSLHLEIRGMRSKTTPTTYIAVKREFKFKGNRLSVLAQLSHLIEQKLRGYFDDDN